MLDVGKYGESFEFLAVWDTLISVVPTRLSRTPDQSVMDSLEEKGWGFR
jgi:hypothetical protein